MPADPAADRVRRRADSRRTLLALAGAISYAVLLRSQEAQIDGELAWGIAHGSIAGPPGCSWILQYRDGALARMEQPATGRLPAERTDVERAPATGITADHRGRPQRHGLPRPHRAPRRGVGAGRVRRPLPARRPASPVAGVHPGRGGRPARQPSSPACSSAAGPWRRWPTPWPGNAASSPTPATSCARRSPRSTPGPSCWPAGARAAATADRRDLDRLVEHHPPARRDRRRAAALGPPRRGPGRPGAGRPGRPDRRRHRRGRRRDRSGRRAAVSVALTVPDDPIRCPASSRPCAASSANCSPTP